MNNKSFFIYLLFCIIFAYGQATTMLKSDQGVIISMFIANCFFCLFMVNKAFAIWKNEKNSFNLKTLVIYSLFVIIYGVLIFILILRKMENSWQTYDTINLVSIFCVFWVLLPSVKINTIKNMLGAIVKGIPQLVFAYSILIEGNQGVSMEMLVAFHVLALPRCYQTYKQWTVNKEDNNKKAMFISEAVNETTWVIVTIAFFTTWKARFKTSLFSNTLYFL